MGSVTEEMSDGGMEDIEDMDDFENLDDIEDLGVDEPKSWDQKLVDMMKQDTSGKSLDRYDLDEYSFMPDSQGSKRILRAVDCGIGKLDIVISDLVIGIFQIYSDAQ